MKLKVFPGRLAVKKIVSKLKGSLMLPEDRSRGFDIAEIVELGNLDSYGVEGKDKTLEKYKIGEIVLFQLPVVMANLHAHKVKDTVTLFIHVNDIIARLDDNRSLDKEEGRLTIDYTGFHVVGRFLLLEPQIRAASSVIIVPDNAVDMNKDSLHFSVLQKGSDVTLPVQNGQEVYPNKGRVNTIFVENKEVCFVDQSSIDGYLDND